MDIAQNKMALLLLPLFSLLLAKSLALGGDKIFTNEYAVYIPNGKETADKLAKSHGFSNEGQIADLENYFLFTHNGISKRSTSSADVHARLLKENEVEWIEQQHVKTRVKRDVNDTWSFNDPLWASQWYLNSYGDATMNVQRAWELGYTGKGVVVSILDDGIEKDHPDLRLNYNPDASYDVNDRDHDPTPRYDFYNTNEHGTRCAGEVAMEAGNGVCGVGIAYNASIGGIRMLDGDVTDAVEGLSLSIRRNFVDIYSASWGPEDNGATVDGPGRIAMAAFRAGIKRGRNGLGSIFVWASGNGGGMEDSCSCDGYANSIYTISVSSANELGKMPWYLEECSSTLATTYSSGGRRKRKVTTADLRGGCSSQFTGTSASAPMAAGICALALEANPDLTWRDLQYIIAETAKHEHLDGQWVTNGAGYKVSHRYGFGLMDAEAMVLLARDWINLPQQKVCTIDGTPGIKLTQSRVSLPLESDGCEFGHVGYLEHVQLNVTLSARYRGDISLTLISPAGTRSTLLPFRIRDRRRGSFDEWTFMSTHFWGETSEGTWILEIQKGSPLSSKGTLKGWQLILRGTSSPPHPHAISQSYSGVDEQIVKRDLMDSDSYDSEYWGSVSDFDDALQCHPECVDGCYGTAANACFRCKNFVDRDTLDCVAKCGDGFYEPFQTNRRCRRCDASCKTCIGHQPDECTSCSGNKALNPDGTCGTDCGEYHYKDGNECKKCPPSCMRCTGTTCDRCGEGMFLKEGSCVEKCEGKVYIDGRTRSCEKCDDSCQTCFGPESSDCMTCPSTGFFKNGKCVPNDSDAECGGSFYLDESDGYGICLPCHASCRTCKGGGPGNCTECEDYYLSYKGFCLIFCDDGTYDYGNNTCVECPPNCALCLKFDGKEVICIECEGSAYLDGDMCVEDCVNGSFNGPNGCVECHSNCVSCWGPGVSECRECSANFYRMEQTCVPFCPSKGYYPNRETNTCDDCHSSCKECDGSSRMNCTNCLNDVPPEEGQCEVVDCDDQCRECYGAPNICTACENDRFLKFASCVEADGQCVTDCGPGFTAVNSNCWSCHPSCGTCSGPDEDECLTCLDASLSPLKGQCHGQCGLGQYQDTTTGSCKSCNSRCLTCNGPGSSECLSCDYYYFRSNDGQCVISCPEEYFEDFEHNICKSCHSSCRTCIGASENDCIDCATDFYLLLSTEQTCVQHCPEGYYESEDEGYKDCRTCSYNCLDCANSYLQCTSCEQDMFLYQDRCQNDCPSGFTNDGNRCVPGNCPDHCTKCNEWGDCEENGCEDNYVEFFGECVQFELECDSGYRRYNPTTDDLECAECDDACEDCVGPGDHDCLKCTEGTHHLTADGRCIECGEGYFVMVETSMCLSCHPSCLTCDGLSPHDCLTCEERLEKGGNGDSASGTCVTGCPPGQYLSDTDGCNPCDENCSRCRGPRSSDCDGCGDGKYLSENECVAICPNGTYHFHPKGSRDGFECKPCHPNCETCFEQDNESCSTCKADLYRQNHTCVHHCDDGYYPAEKNICQSCKPDCRTCTVGNTCTSCVDETQVLYLNECKTKCPDHYYKDQMVCEPCHQQCSSCDGSTLFECTECFPGYVLDDGICFSQCAVGYYFNASSTDDPCLECDSKCEECFGGESDKCISCPVSKVLQRIDVNHANCTKCCEDNEKPSPGDCCTCNEAKSSCLGFLVPQHRRDLLFDPPFHPGPLVFACMMVVVCFLVIFGLLQARSNRQLCWRDSYSRLPTTYDTGSVCEADHDRGRGGSR
ncbi:putative proprotein convertase subtilisin/kexin type 5 isoform X1 [Apostichopus japonicus]|uniref:Putative proprotein convertase subtilisin/kexin type 5 isoform X1 n=1 Tax=Stichopus japonicus TaxID=307972 RepID=A0A2G8LMD4_STIJA|nr:putative proprotein convertase subtilisin/kexin type 5 isoform X1 [Apostichopus japonicus]